MGFSADLIRREPTEAQFTRQVIQLAQAHGWIVAHFRPAMTAKGWRTAVSGDGAGFPDLIMLKADQCIVAELKVGRNKPAPEQVRWLESFADAGIPAFVWKPDSWDEIERTLTA